MIANRSVLAPLSPVTNPKQIAVLCLAQCMLLSLCALAQLGTITSFDPPGSSQTIPLSINNDGLVTGYYSDGSAVHGFLRTPEGSFTAIDGPGSTATYAWSINSAGWIAGYFYVRQISHGFLRAPGGLIIAFDKA